MNQDFIVPATPAVARRLLRLQQVSQIELPDGIDALAQQEMIDPAIFDPLICPYSEERATIMQFLLDNAMRGIVLANKHPCMDEIALLNIARQFSRKITILTLRKSIWRLATRAWFLKDVMLRSPSDAGGSWIDQRRDGTLIVDLTTTNNYELLYKSLVREFPHLVLYQATNESLMNWFGKSIHWPELATLLFPTMPHPASIKTKNNPKLWVTKTLNDFAHFYNVCLFPEFIEN